MGDKVENLWLPCKWPNDGKDALNTSLYLFLKIPVSNGLDFYFIIARIKT